MSDFDIQRPNIQFYSIIILVKVGLFATAIGIEGDMACLEYFHFFSLFGTLCFLITGFFEYKRQNYILSFLSIIGVIVYQPIYSVLKDDVIENSIDVHPIILRSTFITLLLWIIFDFIRLIRDYLKYKKSHV